jgi:SAM-dependent methyltransferase
VKKTLLSYLRCPETGSGLELRNAKFSDSDAVESGTLVSVEGRQYPVTAGVPVMLIPETWKAGQAETRESFSAKWKLAPDYRKSTLPHYTRWYLERFHFGTVENLRRFLSDRRFILDAGTGHGRDAEMFATNSTANVFGIDISYGIYNAYRDLNQIPNLHLVQADLTRLPFPPAFFDFISCDQVLHHTPDTRQSFQALLRHLAPGGYLGIYVYKVKGPIREFCDDFIRETAVQMTPEECFKLSEAVTAFGKSLSELNVEIEVPQDIPILGIKAGKQNLQRFIYWNVFKCYWNDTMDWHSNVITNFDWYHPLHAHRHTPEEVRSWYESAGLEIVSFDVVESGTTVLGRKPS